MHGSLMMVSGGQNSPSRYGRSCQECDLTDDATQSIFCCRRRDCGVSSPIAGIDLSGLSHYLLFLVHTETQLVVIERMWSRNDTIGCYVWSRIARRKPCSILYPIV
jgi:hypothetical protein